MFLFFLGCYIQVWSFCYVEVFFIVFGYFYFYLDYRDLLYFFSVDDDLVQFYLMVLNLIIQREGGKKERGIKRREEEQKGG